MYSCESAEPTTDPPPVIDTPPLSDTELDSEMLSTEPAGRDRHPVEVSYSQKVSCVAVAKLVVPYREKLEADTSKFEELLSVRLQKPMEPVVEYMYAHPFVTSAKHPGVGGDTKEPPYNHIVVSSTVIWP